jgi:short-subunit dehydrogenase
VVASAASKLAPAGEATYAATKHAVHGYCSAVREELRGTGVAVSVLMPTVVATELAAGTSSGLVPLLTADQVADGIVSLVHRPRPELFVPARAGFAAAALAVLPARLRVRLHRFVVPNQVTAARPEHRAGYQARVLGPTEEEPR